MLVILAAGALAAPVHDEFRDKLVIYHQAYDTWLRKFLGCPPRSGKDPGVDGYETVPCDPSMGGMDLKMWQKSRDAAKTFYGLKEKDE